MKKDADLKSNELDESTLNNVSGGKWVLHGLIEDKFGNVYSLNSDRATNLQKLQAVEEQDAASSFVIQNMKNRLNNALENYGKK